MVKKISVVITLLLAVFLLAALWYVQRQEQTDAGRYEVLDQEALPLQVEKRELERELDALEENYEQQMKGMPTAEIVVTDMDEALYDQLYPVMQEAGLQGIMALSDTEYFGRAGNISVSQFNEMLEAGWGYCLGWDGEGDFAEWMSGMAERLRDTRLSVPEAVYFAQGSYSSEYDEILRQYDVTVAVHHGEEEKAVIVTDDGQGDIWYPGAIVWNRSGVRNDFAELISAGGNLTVSVRFAEDGGENTAQDTDREIYVENSFRNMLEYITQQISEGKLLVMTGFEAARACRTEAENSAAGLLQELETRRQDLEAQIGELESRIDEIYGR